VQHIDNNILLDNKKQDLEIPELDEQIDLPLIEDSTVHNDIIVKDETMVEEIGTTESRPLMHHMGFCMRIMPKESYE